MTNRYLEKISNSLGVVSAAPRSYLHISFKKDLHEGVIVPKLPDSALEFLEDLKHNPDLKNDLEDYVTPRFSMAKSLEGCLNGMGHLVKLTKQYPSITFHVYTNKGPLNNVYDSKYLTNNRLVYDAHKTGEVWVTEPLELERVGSFDLAKGNINWKSVHSPKPYDDDSVKVNTGMSHYKYRNLPEFKL